MPDVTDDQNPLPYAATDLDQRKTHSVLGMATALWPVLILLYCGNVFGKEGAVLLLIGPVMCVAAVTKALTRKRRLLVPLMSLAFCAAMFGAVLYLVWD